MYTKCNRCGAILKDPGVEFACPRCGNRMRTRAAFMEKMEHGGDVPPIAQYGELTLFNVFKGITSAGCLLAVLAYCVSLLMSVVVFFYAIPEVGRHWPEMMALPFIMVPAPVAVAVLEGKAALAYWAFIVIMMFITLVWTFWPELEGLKKSFRESLKRLKAPSRSNDRTLFMVGQMFMAIFFFDMVYYMFIEVGGASPNTPAFDDYQVWENLYGFLNASVWEEIAGRVLLIGLPFLFYKVLIALRDGYFDRYMNEFIPSLKKALKILWGGHGQFTSATVGLAVFSSLMFGFAHMSGWDAYKVIPTAMSGFGFAYLYIKKGLHSAILLHFMFDYLGMAQDFLPDRPGVWLTILIIFLLWIVAGFVYFVYYSAKVFRFFAEPDRKWRRPAQGTSTRKVWDLLGWK